MKLDNKGVLLLEQVVSIFIISIIATMIFTALLYGTTVFIDSYRSHTSTTSTYNIIEKDRSAVSVSGTIKFQSDGGYIKDELYPISGTYVYGNDMCEFTIN